MNLFEALKENVKTRNKFPSGEANPDYKHGLRRHKLYGVWSSMKARCLNPNDRGYKNYGSRGVTVCIEWRNDFKCFFDWAIGAGYREGLELDRIDVNGNYQPQNCRFVSREAQSLNKRATLYFSNNKPLKTKCEEMSLPYKTVAARLNRGYTMTESVVDKIVPRYKGEKAYCSKLTDDKALFIFESAGKISQPKLSKMFGVSEAVVYKIQKKIKWKHIHKDKEGVEA